MAEDEEILGYAILRVLGVEGELESIAVKKKHQGKGFGKQLLREILYRRSGSYSENIFRGKGKQFPCQGNL